MKDMLVRLMGWKATVLHGDPIAYDRWRWLQNYLKPGAHRTLDAGCGSGCFVLYAAQIGNEAVGVDFSPYNVETARRRASLVDLNNARFHQGDLRNIDQMRSTLGTFDQIICFEAIEHIFDDRKVVEDLSSLLNPGGRLILTTPYKFYKRMLGDELSTVEDGGHVRWGYTHEEMKKLFEEAGLKVVAQDHISGVISQQLTNAMRLVARGHSKLGWGVTFPFRILQTFDTKVTDLIHYPYFSIGVVGEKRGKAVQGNS